MNRNDVVLPVTGSDVAKPSKTNVVSPRSAPRVFDSSSVGSYKRSPRQPKSAGSLGRPTFPKGALLEEKSVHLPMPSFHERNNLTLGWECAGCGSVNQSALSNECSVCGMLRSVDFDYKDMSSSESMAGDDDVSFSSIFDGNASESSLSHHNFSILDKQPEMVDRQFLDKQQRGHASMPVLHSSFTSIASQRTTRTALNRRRAQGLSQADHENNNNDDDDDVSVISFRNWNGNKKVKPWECGACTFINENPLHLVCEMCGSRRDGMPPGTESSAAHIPLDQSTTEEDEDPELEMVRNEQIRELIDIQRDIMANFGSRANSSLSSIHAEESKFNTSDLQREIAEMQASMAPRLDYNDIDSTEYELERVKEVIRAQQEIMLDFKRNRTGDNSERLDKKTPSPLASTLLSPSSQKASASADSLFGASNQPNTTPNNFLKSTMKAAGGMLRQEDLILPILWGDDLGKAEKKVGSAGSVASRSSRGSKR